MILSPYNTLQEQQVGKPYECWRIMAVCCMLNNTHGRQVRPMIEQFFATWKTPHLLMRADLLKLANMLRPLGFHNKRTGTLVRMSDDYLRKFGDDDPKQSQRDASWVRSMHGCGPYAEDSVAIFVYDVDQVNCKDGWLDKYVTWRKLCKLYPNSHIAPAPGPDPINPKMELL